MRATPLLATLVILGTVSFTMRSSGHPWHGETAPVRASEMPAGFLGDTRGGYGYVGPSEAESYWMLDYRCEEDKPPCDHCEPSSLAPATRERIADTNSTVAGADLLRRARKNAFEFLALQLAALDPARTPDFEPPDCLGNDPSLRGLFKSLPAEQPSNAEIEAMRGQKQLLMHKYRAVGGTLSSGNIVRALVYNDLLETTMAERNCAREESAACTSMGGQLARLKESIPVLFHGEAEAAQSRQAKLRASIHALLGARQPGEAQARSEHGASAYSAALSDAAKGAATIGIEKAVAERSDEARLQDPATPAETNAALKSALDGVNSSIAEMRAEFARSVRSSRVGLCELSLRQLAEIAPNIIRQMVVDLDERQREPVREYLCENDLIDKFAIDPQCTGFTKQTAPDKTVYEIDQRRSFFPYASDVKYRLTEPRSGHPTVDMTVNVISDVPEAELNRLLGTWAQKANTWFNCQSGSAPGSNPRCPPSGDMPKPPIKFNISFKRVAEGSTERNVVRVTKCIHAELPRGQQSDCAAARQLRLNNCLNTYLLRQSLGGAQAQARYGKDLDMLLENISMPPLIAQASATSTAPPDFLNESENQLRQRCERETPPVGDPRNNRAKADHYSTALEDGTLMHEVAHLMGLADEYKDPNYPFSPLGEHDSLMNSSRAQGARLYPRHIDQIYGIKRCDQQAQVTEAGR